MELINKRISYQVADLNEDLSISGLFYLNEDSEILAFSGTINKDNISVCKFHYSELNNKISKSLRFLDKSYLIDSMNLLKDTIANIKQTL